MKRQPCLAECETCPLRARAVVCDLTDEDNAAFHAIKHVFRYEPRQTVFYEGHACLGLYVLCAGRVKLTRTAATGQRQIVTLLGAGEMIEKHTFKPEAVHEVTCETLEPSQLCVIEREPYLELLRRNSALAIRLLEAVSVEVGRQLNTLDRAVFATARQRLAQLLLELAEQFGGERLAERQVGIVLRREEVAEMTGVAVETAIRLLSVFRRDGLLRIEGRRITILQPERLARIARR